MPTIYKLGDIYLGNAVYTGHEVYPNAVYQPARKKIIYKKNKRDNPTLSRFEVAFSRLAALFLAPHLTPQQILTIDERQDVTGVASEHICYVINTKEKNKRHFYTINFKQARLKFALKEIEQTDDIPFYFLNNFPSGFFAALYQAYNDGRITVDMRSLASVLTSAYTLEEDDLHKGNFGFYIVEKKGKACVVFFRIDHDLMLSDSVMSQYDSRIVNCRHTQNAYAITKRDIKTFPLLRDSKNHFWPTIKRYLVKPGDTKTYSRSDVKTFIKLAKSKEFNQAKWTELYKHILIPVGVIESSLANGFDVKTPIDKAEHALIAHAVIARQAKLRAVFFTISSFRNFIGKLDENAKNKIISDILIDITDSQLRNKFTIAIRRDMQHYQDLCQVKNGNGFVKGDTPLHAAIRLNDYRYDETWQAFGKFAHKANSKGEKPLDIATARAVAYIHANDSKIRDVRGDPLLMIKNLLANGVEQSAANKTFFRNHKFFYNNYRFGIKHITQAGKAKNATELVNALQALGEDHQFSLKMKKEIAILSVKEFLNQQKPLAKAKAFQSDLVAFKIALNGNGAINAPTPELQFIRQLRSRLWIIRKWRGLFGGTATQVAINHLIDQELEKPSLFSKCYSFFCCAPIENDEENCMTDSIEVSRTYNTI